MYRDPRVGISVGSDFLKMSNYLVKSFSYAIYARGRPDPHFYVPGAKVPSTLPQIVNHDELVHLFTVTTDLRHRAVLMTAYAAGLRASELGRLQLSDVDSARMCLRVDQGQTTRTATSRSRPSCWSCCASTGTIADPSAGCSPPHPSTAR